MNYAKPLARDNGGAAMQEYPAPIKTVTSVMMRENASASSVMILDQNTSAIEVGAFGGQGLVIRWIPVGEAPGNFYTSVISSGLAANFDHYVPAGVGIGAYRRFVVPRETGGAPTGATGSVNGLYQRLAVTNAGTVATSVLVTQY